VTFISIHRQRLARNINRRAKVEPPIRVANSRSDAQPRYYHGIKINGTCTLYYWPQMPVLKCGAKLVIETKAKVTRR
jgi:hypothetical protein